MRRSTEDVEPSSGSRWWFVPHAAVTAVVVAGLAIPRQLVLMDGGLHLSSATALRGLVDGRWGDLLTWRPVLAPNLTVEALALVLTPVLDGDVVVRGLAVVVVLGFSGAVLLLARAAGAPWWSATLALPFAANVSLMAGLLGFAAAVVLAVITIAVALRPVRTRPVQLALLLALTWFTHLIPALSAVVAVVAVLLVRVGMRRTLRSAGPGVAVVALLTLGFAATGGSDGGISSRWFGGGARAADLTKAVASWSRWEYQLVRVLTVLLVVAVVLVVAERVRRRRVTGAPWLRRIDGLLVAALVLEVIAVVTPESIGSVSLAATRLAVLPPVLLTAWVGAQAGARGTFADGSSRLARTGTAVVAVAAAAAVGVTVALVVVRTGPLRAEGERLAEIRSMSACAPHGATIVQLDTDDGRDRAVTLRPDSSFVGYVAADAGLLDLGNVSGTASYYVWGYTDRARAVPVLAPSQDALESVPPDVDLAGAMRAGYPLDSVLVVGTPDPADDAWRPTSVALGAGFRQVATTRAGSLWVRRDLPAGC
ncbi:hypothetical protein [Actinomycetospora chiangmaiensis]|uniref:hypothetical protein n=1 Tax=Actinomycetospora chiangmaiensis TaxID=402650 RepID=UPI00035D4BDF|nr:hypothetical protein [Actinomycetospora chiangmaiensis]